MHETEKPSVRRGAPGSEVRARLVEAAEALLREEGYGALTAGRLAGTLGLKRQIVHYYFGSIEELVIAVIHRRAEGLAERRAQLLSAREPLRTLWEGGHSTDPVTFELMAVAARRPAIRAAMATYLAEARRGIASAMAERGQPLDARGIALAMAIMSLSQGLAIDRSLGLDLGAAEAKMLAEEWLRDYAG